jgi:hypothetical protein
LYLIYAVTREDDQMPELRADDQEDDREGRGCHSTLRWRPFADAGASSSRSASIGWGRELNPRPTDYETRTGEEPALRLSA